MDDTFPNVDNTAILPMENMMVGKFSVGKDDSKLDSETIYLDDTSMVNIFYLRAAFKQTWKVAYYFIYGNLDGDELLRHFIFVIIAC